MFSKIKPPANAGIPPNTAAYHGIFSESFSLISRSRLSSLNMPTLSLSTSPIHSIFASAVSSLIGLLINARF